MSVDFKIEEDVIKSVELVCLKFNIVLVLLMVMVA